MKVLIAIAMLSSLLGSCGKSKDDDSKTAVQTFYGDLKTSLLTSDTVDTYKQTTATCTNDSNSGLLTATFTGENSSKVDIRIKGFSTTDKTYTCTQASDNKAAGSVGQKFDVCSVELTLPNSVSSTDVYEMYRTDSTQDAFTYAGNCTIAATYSSPRVNLTVNCTDMIQTIRKGAARNPIEPSVTAKVRGETVLNCNI